MKVAVIGSGGREHALVKQLKKSPLCTELIAIPGNGGISQECACVAIKATDIDQIVNFCTSNLVDFVVVAPDDPLALGMVDALEKKGIPAFGPKKSAARIESSKVFAKEFMAKYNIPTAAYKVFSDGESACRHINLLEQFPVVIKADGLALGKGVFICDNASEALAAVESLLFYDCFGDAGRTIVVEEFLEGPEVSLLAFCDGKTIVPMVSSMDHKRSGENNTGKNTGGMGAIAPNPYYTPQIADQCMAEIFRPTVDGFLKEGLTFSGCLYFGLMLTEKGPRVIEYNARFGDPETQAILPLLQTDLLEIMISCSNGTLSSEMVCFSAEASACVVLASAGYPEACQTGFPIHGISEAESCPDVTVYQAGTQAGTGEPLTAGGRVLAVTATASDLTYALEKAYGAVEKIRFSGANYRRDIGATALHPFD